MPHTAGDGAIIWTRGATIGRGRKTAGTSGGTGEVTVVGGKSVEYSSLAVVLGNCIGIIAVQDVLRGLPLCSRVSARNIVNG